MSIGFGSTWNDEEEDDYDSNVSPVGNRDWIEEEDDSNVSPVGKKDWLEDEEE